MPYNNISKFYTEKRMTNAGILKKHDALFKSDTRYNWYQIEDDHIPFLKQGELFCLVSISLVFIVKNIT